MRPDVTAASVRSSEPNTGERLPTAILGAAVWLACAGLVLAIGLEAEEILAGPRVTSAVWTTWIVSVGAAVIATVVVGAGWSSWRVPLVSSAIWGILSAYDYITAYAEDIEPSALEGAGALLLLFSVVAAAMTVSVVLRHVMRTVRPGWVRTLTVAGVVVVYLAYGQLAGLMHPLEPMPVGRYAAMSPTRVAIRGDVLSVTVRDESRQTVALLRAASDMSTRYEVDGKPVSLKAFLDRTDLLEGSRLVDIEIRRPGRIAAISWESE